MTEMRARRIYTVGACHLRRRADLRLDVAANARGVPLVVVDLRAQGLRPVYSAEMLRVRPDRQMEARTRPKKFGPAGDIVLWCFHDATLQCEA